MSASGASREEEDDGGGTSGSVAIPAEAAGGILGSLHQLHGFLRSRDPGLECEAAHGLLRRVGEECVVTAQGSSELALKTSLIFSKEFGLLLFINKSLSIDEFRDCREETLKFLYTFLEKIGPSVQPYALDVKLRASHHVTLV